MPPEMTVYLQDADLTLYHGDAITVLRRLPDDYATACVTSPPYLDARPEYPSPTIDEFAAIFCELHRVITDCALFNVGRLWRAGVEQLWWLDLLRVAQHAGWNLLDTLVWVKPNANPLHGQVFANSHEYVLILGRAGSRLNTDAIRTEYAPSSVARLERGWTNHIAKKNVHSDRQRSTDELHADGARPRSFVSIPTGTEKDNAHPAPMALALGQHLVALATFPSQTVLDPFAGSGTTLLAARNLGRWSVGIEREAGYCALAARRLQQLSLLAEGAA